jgi:mRNA interferase MazF
MADLGIAGKVRPVIIVSRKDENPPRDLVLYVPCTTKNRGSEYEVDLAAVSCLREGGVANIQGLGSIPSRRLERKLGTVPDGVLSQIRSALKYAFALE